MAVNDLVLPSVNRHSRWVEGGFKLENWRPQGPSASTQNTVTRGFVPPLPSRAPQIRARLPSLVHLLCTFRTQTRPIRSGGTDLATRQQLLRGRIRVWHLDEVNLPVVIDLFDPNH